MSTRTAAEAALSLLARREHSRRELAEKLSRRGYEDLEPLLDELESKGSLSDERYAEFMARHRSSQGYGPRRIEAELKHHGIEGGTIHLAIEALEVDWVDLAAGQLGPDPLSRSASDRARRRLNRKGFHPDHIRQALDRLQRDTTSF